LFEEQEEKNQNKLSNAETHARFVIVLLLGYTCCKKYNTRESIPSIKEQNIHSIFTNRQVILESETVQ
jgi:hypothetical protein